jgi:hypothetical protein
MNHQLLSNNSAERGCNFLNFFRKGFCVKINESLLRGHSITTWTRLGGKGVKKWQNYFHLVVECP